MFSKQPPQTLLNYTLKDLERKTREAGQERIGDYIVSKTTHNDMFTDFRYYSLQQSLSTGWKAHLSILPKQLSESYKIIVPILLKYDVLQFKFSDVPFMKTCLKKLKSNESFLKDTERLYHGMQVTIYMEKDQEQSFNEMLGEIETALNQENIEPGVISSSDRTLGKYSSVRHQGTRQYTNSKDVQSYNPENVDDPFVEVDALQKKFTP